MANMLMDYSDINETIVKIDSPLSTSTIHGILTGFICTGPLSHGKSWLEPLLGKKLSIKEAEIKNKLISLYETTYNILLRQDFSFQLLLPAEETDLRERAEALSDWCQGFLTGLAFAGLNIDSHELEEETKEIFYHLREFAKLDYEDITVSEQDEEAFTELYEYIRSATMMIFMENNQLIAKNNCSVDSSDLH